MQNQKTTNTFTKKIGKATYQVKIHFSQNSKQTFNDKVLRLVNSDVAIGTKDTAKDKSHAPL